MRRPWSIAEALGPLPDDEIEKTIERTRMPIDCGMPIANCSEP